MIIPHIILTILCWGMVIFVENKSVTIGVTTPIWALGFIVLGIYFLFAPIVDWWKQLKKNKPKNDMDDMDNTDMPV